MANGMTVKVAVPADVKEMVKMLADGFTAEQIASKKFTNKRAIESLLYRTRIAHGANNTTHLVAIFLRNGIIK